MNRSVFGQEMELQRALHGVNGTVALVVTNGIGEEVPADDGDDRRRDRRPTEGQRGFHHRGGHPRNRGFFVPRR